MRRLAMIVFVILTVVSLLSSCSMNHQSDDIFQVEIHQGEQETVLSSISSKTHATTEMPDLAKLLERSDVIIKGQVLQQINQTRANPEGDKVNKYGQVIENALLTYYSFRVDESFLGDYAPEPLGDYYAGPNHVLPTSGTARFFSPLGVNSFEKRSSFIYYTEEALREAKDDIVLVAEKEGLTAHANAIKVRF